jgi:hypothetical protein
MKERLIKRMVVNSVSFIIPVEIRDSDTRNDFPNRLVLERLL